MNSRNKMKSLVKICSKCGEHRLKSYYTSARSMVCNICKINGSRSFQYKSCTYNLNTSKLKGMNGCVKYRNKKGDIHLVPLNIAKKNVQEGRAGICDEETIDELFNLDQLQNHVRRREKHTCQLCGNLGTIVKMIVSKKEEGLQTPFNLHCICQSCKHELDFPSERSQNPKNIYAGKNELNVYCDCSIYNRYLFGIGLVFVGEKVIRTLGKLFHLSKSKNSVFGELLAIYSALNFLKDKKYREFETIVIYSDIDYIDALLSFETINADFTELVSRINNLVVFFKDTYPQTTITIRYIGEQRNVHYKAAHNLARASITKNDVSPCPIDELF